MKPSHKWQAFIFSDLGVLLLLGIFRFITLFITNGQSGWHRDELDMLENARHLTWGYISYPPLAPFIARIALTLFGPSLIGVRFFSTLALSISMVLTGLMVRELGGKRPAQVTAAVAQAIAPFALMGGGLFHYSSFDFLWWILIAYQVVRLIKSQNPRWWLGIGAVIGLGLMTKYAIAYLVAGLVLGVIVTRNRRYLLSPWLWAGVGLSFLIVLPNLIWQYQHEFISLDFLQSIHRRDVYIGRAEGFLKEQFLFTTNLVTVPLWLAGLFYFFLSKSGRNYRMIAWMFIVPWSLFFYSQGRSYYVTAAYATLYAGGAMLLEQGLAKLPQLWSRVTQVGIWSVFAVSGAAFAVLALPIATVGSETWDKVSAINEELKEEIGWEDLVRIVGTIYNNLPAEDKSVTGILANNYGELGAIALYGPEYGLPEPISAVNSYRYRGYGNPPPQILIMVGFIQGHAEQFFKRCKAVGFNQNKYDVMNMESEEHPVIFLCREPKMPWDEMWKRLEEYN